MKKKYKPGAPKKNMCFYFAENYFTEAVTKFLVKLTSLRDFIVIIIRFLLFIIYLVFILFYYFLFNKIFK